jgi:ribonuclease E
LALLDLPIAPVADKPRRAAVADPEHLLESVLDALPEPKQPGQGRGRSRRVSTASLAGGQAVGSDGAQRQTE